VIEHPPSKCKVLDSVINTKEKTRLGGSSLNPSYSGGKRLGGSKFKACQGKKFSRPPHLNPRLDTVVHACHPSYLGKHK
jgi:hypothetical protein